MAIQPFTDGRQRFCSPTEAFIGAWTPTAAFVLKQLQRQIAAHNAASIHSALGHGGCIRKTKKGWLRAHERATTQDCSLCMENQTSRCSSAR